MSNVRFYRLSTLPNFDSSKVGIFVHLTQAGESGSPKAGLWFCGATGWEYLTNDTTPESITNAINALDVTGYAQADIYTNQPTEGEQPSGSTLTISGIKEDNGIISKDDTKKLEVAIDGVYNENTNKIATKSTVTNAINGLNAGTIQAVTTAQATDNNANTVLTFNGIKEENGVIAQGDGKSTFTVGDAKLKIQIGSATATDVFSANAKSDSIIQLDGNVFKKDKNNVISVITLNNDVSSTNPLVTKDDINGLARAMHYRGSIVSNDKWPESVEAGDVYIATGDFIHRNTTSSIDDNISIGDMIVFNSKSLDDYNVIQSNITLGTDTGQIAANDGKLEANNLVVATGNGIQTIIFDATNLTDTNKNTRTLTYTNGTADTSDDTLFHSATITDSLKIMNRDFNESINISSTNRSIKIAKNADENATGIIVDLVWNTTIE